MYCERFVRKLFVRYFRNLLISYLMPLQKKNKEKKSLCFKFRKCSFRIKGSNFSSVFKTFLTCCANTMFSQFFRISGFFQPKRKPAQEKSTAANSKKSEEYDPGKKHYDPVSDACWKREQK